MRNVNRNSAPNKDSALHDIHPYCIMYIFVIKKETLCAYGICLSSARKVFLYINFTLCKVHIFYSFYMHLHVFGYSYCDLYSFSFIPQLRIKCLNKGL